MVTEKSEGSYVTVMSRPRCQADTNKIVDFLKNFYHESLNTCTRPDMIAIENAAWIRVQAHAFVYASIHIKKNTDTLTDLLI